MRRALPSLDALAALGLVALLAACLGGERAWRQLDPAIDAELCFWFDGKQGPGGYVQPELDPWGSPWRDAGCWAPSAAYSSGPNRVDEGGRGDDVWIPAVCSEAALLADGLPAAAGVLALWLAVFHPAARLAGRSRYRGLAVPWLVLMAGAGAAGIVSTLCPLPQALLDDLRARGVLTPPRVAVWLSAGGPFAGWILAAALLSRPGEPPEAG